jgi:hypothetical protein
MLFDWLRTRFTYGPTSFQRISGTIWLLDATGPYGCWMQPAADGCLELLFRLLDDDILIELKMDTFCCFSFVDG